MTIQDKAFNVYKDSRLADKVQDDLNSGMTPDDNHFIQGVYDNTYSLLAGYFTEDEMEDIEIGDILDTYHFS